MQQVKATCKQEIFIEADAEPIKIQDPIFVDGVLVSIDLNQYIE